MNYYYGTGKSLMQIINVETLRGLVLKGVMWGNPSDMDTVVIMMSGICSNVFQNELLPTSGKLLSENNIAFICGQAMDAFSFIGYSNLKTKKQVTTGVVTNDFNVVYEDVEAYVKYAKNLGFKRIILAGHSLGSNKIINYLANTPDNLIDYFIVSAPIDLAHFWNIIKDKDMYIQTANKFVAEGRGKDILPFLFMGFSPMCAETLLAFYNAENLKNCPVISNDGETDSLSSIKINGTFIIGSNDNMAGDNAEVFIREINSYCKHPEKNRIVIIPYASHIFYGKHKEYAEAILETVSHCSI